MSVSRSIKARSAAPSRAANGLNKEGTPAMPCETKGAVRNSSHHGVRRGYFNEMQSKLVKLLHGAYCAESRWAKSKFQHAYFTGLERLNAGSAALALAATVHQTH